MPVVTLLFSLIHVMCMVLHHTVVTRYSTRSITYWTPCHISGFLVIYCKCYGFQRVFFTQAFFTLHSFVKLADLWNIALAWLFAWLTEIHKRFVHGRLFRCLSLLKVSIPQSRNFPQYGTCLSLVLNLHS